MRISSRKVTKKKFILKFINQNSSSLTIGHLIGKGAFGFVYQGLAKGINSDEKITTVAIKTVRGKLINIIINNISSLNLIR